jgi:LAO/AO transport system kinase
VRAATRSPADLAARVRAGDRRAIGRAISLCENGEPEAEPLVADLWRDAGRAVTIGLTGPPGVGKSTLVGALVGHLRASDLSVGVVAVDPSSPFTRGALLGDRIRMADHFLDPGVFIRSMGTRGHLGGVAEATFLAMVVLDAAGKDVVIVETVGVGQSEVEVRSLVDVVALILQPGSGDSIQVIKAGLMEIPDVICLNKRDHPSAPAARRELHHALALGDKASRPAVVESDAVRGEGIAELWDGLVARRDALGDEGLAARRRANLARELVTIAAARSSVRLAAVIADEIGNRLLERLEAGEIDPVRAVRELQDAARDDA